MHERSRLWVAHVEATRCPELGFDSDDNIDTMAKLCNSLAATTP